MVPFSLAFHVVTEEVGYCYGPVPHIVVGVRGNLRPCIVDLEWLAMLVAVCVAHVPTD